MVARITPGLGPARASGYPPSTKPRQARPAGVSRVSRSFSHNPLFFSLAPPVSHTAGAATVNIDGFWLLRADNLGSLALLTRSFFFPATLSGTQIGIGHRAVEQNKRDHNDNTTRHTQPRPRIHVTDLRSVSPRQ